MLSPGISCPIQCIDIILLRIASTYGPTLLDRSLLRDVGKYAFAFMEATRRLPHFDPRWEAKTVIANFGAFKVADGDLKAEGRRFAKKYEKAMQVVDSTPLTPEDVHMLLLCLRRKLANADAARAVLQYICKCRASKVCNGHSATHPESASIHPRRFSRQH